MTVYNGEVISEEEGMRRLCEKGPGLLFFFDKVWYVKYYSYLFCIIFLL